MNTPQLIRYKFITITPNSWEKQTGGYPPGHALYGFGKSWQPQPQAQATSHFRSLFEGARWAIAADGTFLFSAWGLNPEQQGTPPCHVR